MKRICVFCGSSLGFDEIFAEQAYLLGKTLAQRNIGLVYGGSNIGLMRELANAALEYHGEVIGVMPHFMKEKELAHQNLSSLEVVNNMQERKSRMYELSNGAIALPGGFGTLDELFELLTWGQLGLHQKPIALLNTVGYYNNLLSFIQTMVDKGFVGESSRAMILVHDEVDSLLDLMFNYRAPEVDKWRKHRETNNGVNG
ncbi:MAG: TIGR00730 family Rossman fold protein [Bacteroidales bacterium]|nr:TIGR00730 family Rossman fold protein [Bacteroidales bacterium]MCL2132730.1 TIGR00730 family Rossman fold protein [Bacteroidales bacterium]